MKKIMLLVFLITLFSHAKGQGLQNTSNHQWTIGLGYQNARTFDRNISPLIYSSNNGVLSSSFLKNKLDTQWTLGLTLSAGSNQSKRHGKRTAVIHDPDPLVGESEETIYEINPALSYVDLELSYGFQWKLDNSFVGFEAYDRLLYGALGADTWFFNQLSVAPSYRRTVYSNSPVELTIEGSLPVFSYLLRQPYTLDPSLPEESYFKAYLSTGSSVATINQFQQVNLGSTLTYELKNGKNLGVSWQFMWMNYNNIPDRQLRSYSNSINITYQL